MRPITVWYRWDEFLGEWSYNHYSDGHSHSSLPVPPAGQNWRGRWQHYRVWLTDDHPTPKIVWYGPDDLTISK